ncbi:MAG: acyltransferase [Coriobacteriia bacterium]|nr:acyltransferase [Coriobacteriia bacterium]
MFRLAYANVIKFIAAILVITTHSFCLSQNQPDPLYLATNNQISLGAIAVSIFFMYSGIYINKSIQRTKKARKYLYKRCIRLFPALIIVILFSVFVLGPLLTTFKISDYFINKTTFLYLLNILLIPIHNLPGVFTSNCYNPTVNGALWTLPIEFICYIVLLLFWLTSNKSCKIKLKYLNVIALFINLILLIIAMLYGNDLIISAIRAIVFFFIGTCLYDFAKYIKLHFVGLIIVFVCLIISFIMRLANFAIILFFPYFILCLTFLFPKIKNFKLFNISYEMYLLGFPIQQTLVHFWGGQMPILINFTLALPIDIILGFIVYKISNIIISKLRK